MPSVTVITSVSLKVDENYIGRSLFIHSEVDQLYSEVVNISVSQGEQYDTVQWESTVWPALNFTYWLSVIGIGQSLNLVI